MEALLLLSFSFSAAARRWRQAGGSALMATCHAAPCTLYPLKPPCQVVEHCRCHMAACPPAPASINVRILPRACCIGAKQNLHACNVDPALLPSCIAAATYTGHAWRLCDETTGVPLAEYVGASATVTLRADGSVRVASTEAAAPEDAAGPSGKAPEFELDLEDQEGSGEEEQGSDDEKSSGEGVLPQSATAP